MFKSKLQEFCQRQGWGLPDYTTVKDGPDHMPSFNAFVNVKGDVFETWRPCKSAKEAQNFAAQIAYEHYNPPRAQRLAAAPVPRPSPPVGAAAPVPRPSPPPPVGAAAPVPWPSPPVGAAAPVYTVQSAAQIAENPSGFPVPPLPASLPKPSAGLLAVKVGTKIKSASMEVLQQNEEGAPQETLVYRASIGSYDTNCKDTLPMYKNQLQQYAQKKNLGSPAYTSVVEGPPHARRFKSRVSLDGKSYESVEFFSTQKEAEQAAAKVACQMLSVDLIQEVGGLYKSLLQEFVQKKGLVCPSYDTVSSGPPHQPLFVSTVEIGNDSFKGQEAKTKKQAEMNAAKAAYYALTNASPAKQSSEGLSITRNAIGDNGTENLQRTAMIKNQQNARKEAVEQAHAKKARSTPGNMNENTHIQSDDSSLLSFPLDVPTASSAGPFTEQQGGCHPSPKVKTIVFARKLSLPIPECASVMPYSDDQWIAYKVEPKPEPIL